MHNDVRIALVDKAKINNKWIFCPLTKFNQTYGKNCMDVRCKDERGKYFAPVNKNE